MFNNITLGQYYPTNSPVHALDPRMKIILLVLFIVGLFAGSGFYTLGLAALFILIAAKASRLPVKLLVKSIKPLRWILILTFVMNLFFMQGETVLFRAGFIVIYTESLKTAVIYSARLVLLVVGSSLLTLTTSPITLTDGLERLFSPLRVIRFPAHEMAMMMTIALRFIPTLLDEADKIMKAQMARGADFESGKLLSRAKAMIPLLVPLFVSAFRRAGELATAMEARCYHGGEGRTRLHILKLKKNDYIALTVTVLFTAGMILASRLL